MDSTTTAQKLAALMPADARDAYTDSIISTKSVVEVCIIIHKFV